MTILNWLNQKFFNIKCIYYEKYTTKNSALSREYAFKKDRKLRNFIKNKFRNNENINTITL